MLPDLVNAMFEGVGAVIGVLSVRAIRAHRQVRGVSVWPVVFFTSWGFWNMFYYPYLGQYLSTGAAIAMTAVNATWLYFAWKYRGN